MFEKVAIQTKRIAKPLIITSVIITVVYLLWWINPANPDNIFLYLLLFFAELFHVTLLFIMLSTLWPRRGHLHVKYTPNYTPSVDIFIPAAGEPVEIVRATAQAALKMDYPNFKVYILNDGYVAKKDNWQEVAQLAQDLGIKCITRIQRGDAKAQNINKALEITDGEIIVIFDSDMVPHQDFLKKTIFYFQDPRIAFVQTPQYYKNYKMNDVTRAAWEQQAFFYGPIMVGKEKSNSSFLCGTNVAIRRKALEDVGGMNTTSITEDVLTSLFIHQKGWESVYVSEVLTEGLAPEDLSSYYKQQLRWARGGLELLFKNNPLSKKGLTFVQKMEYLSSSLYYFSGVAILIDIIMPVMYLLLGTQPVKISSTTFSFFFIPYIFLVLYMMYMASNGAMTFRAFSFSFSSFTLQLRALYSLITGAKMRFVITPKQQQRGRFLNLVFPHLLYIGIFVAASILALLRYGLITAVAVNIAWGLFNITLFIPFIRAAFESE